MSCARAGGLLCSGEPHAVIFGSCMAMWKAVRSVLFGGAKPLPEPHHEIPTIYEDKFVRITYLERESDFVTLCFSGIGLGLGVIDLQDEEFIGSSSRIGSSVFVFDLTRSWGNCLDFVHIERALRPILAGRHISSLGNSMGEFLAVVATGFFDIKTCVAFVAQFSVKSSVLPAEQRWMNYREHIYSFKFESLAPFFNNTTRYYMLNSSEAVEERHWSKFPSKSNVTNIVFDCNHNLATSLKSKGMLNEVIMCCLANGDLPSALEGKIDFRLLNATCS